MIGGKSRFCGDCSFEFPFHEDHDLVSLTSNIDSAWFCDLSTYPCTQIVPQRKSNSLHDMRSGSGWRDHV
jgi:hypothetical protein